MNLNSITGLAGVTVIAGVTPFAAGGSANDGTVVTGTLTSNNMRMGSVDGPAFDVFASISGLGAGSENTRQVSGALRVDRFRSGRLRQGERRDGRVGRLGSLVRVRLGGKT